MKCLLKLGWPLQIGRTIPELLKQGLLYPLQMNILETEKQDAARVASLYRFGPKWCTAPCQRLGIHPQATCIKPEYPQLLGAVAKAA